MFAQGEKQLLGSHKILPPSSLLPAHKAHQSIGVQRSPPMCSWGGHREKENIPQNVLLAFLGPKIEKDDWLQPRQPLGLWEREHYLHPHPNCPMGPSSVATPKKSQQKKKESSVEND